MVTFSCNGVGAMPPASGCVFPDAVNDDQLRPCAYGSTINILKTVAGPVLYALSALFMPDIPALALQGHLPGPVTRAGRHSRNPALTGLPDLSSLIVWVRRRRFL